MAIQFTLIFCLIVTASCAGGVPSGCIQGVANQRNPTHSSCLSASPGLNAVYKSNILSKHNAYRSSTALDPSPSSSLSDIRWNTELAATAQGWANQCIYGTDDKRARNVPAQGWSDVQQNVAIVDADGSSPYSKAIAKWGSQKTYFKYGTGTNPSYANITNYIPIISSSTTYLGCAATVCNTIIPADGYSSGTNAYNGGFGYKYIVVCNYAPGPISQTNPYPAAISISSGSDGSVSPTVRALTMSISAAIVVTCIRN